MKIYEKPKNDSAFYYEVCMLRMLASMGYLNEEELNGIIRIAAEDFGSALFMDRTLLCPNS